MNNIPRGIEAIHPIVREIVLDKKGLEKLQDEADKGLWRENISFLEAYLEFCQALSDRKFEEAKSLAKSITTSFVRKDSAAQVNLDDEIVHQIEAKLQGFVLHNDNTNLFDEAAKQTSHMIYRDKAEVLTRIKSRIEGNASPSLSRASSGDFNNTIAQETAQKTLKNMQENWIRGPLYFKKGTFSKWVLMTCVKKGNFLFQFKLGANHITSSPSLVVNLAGARVSKEIQSSSRPFYFLLITKTKTYEFRALSQEEYDVWINLLSGKVEPTRASILISSKSSVDYSHEPSISSHSSTSSKPNDASSIFSSASSSQSDELQIILSCLDSFTDSVIIGNSSGLIVAMNQAALKMFGYTQEDVVGQEVSILMPEPYKSQHCAYIFRHEKFGDVKLLGKTRDLKAERKNGEVFNMQISLSKIKDHFMATIREKSHIEMAETAEMD